jgi:UDP-2,3-diacylglucosamine pyrophosphatase LpxH
MTHARTVYVISDLHLGGDPDFRMMTEPHALADFIHTIADVHPCGQCELVINGDFVDFLAQNHGTAAAPSWRPFSYDPQQARASFEAIASGEDAPVFDALAALLQRGQRLTILPGNHDIELCTPAVREALRERIGALSQPNFQLHHDGEAYVIGDVLIEHGNRYDDYNAVDHEALHQLRVKQTLRQTEGIPPFDPPVGSKFVAAVMNPIKAQLGFIDLLKPEGPALVAVLLAIAPEQQRPAIDSLVEMMLEHRKQRRQAVQSARDEPVYRTARAPRGMPAPDQLSDLLCESLGEDLFSDALVDEPTMRGSATRGRVGDLWNSMTNSGGFEVVHLLFKGRKREVERYELLRRAIRKIAPDEAEALERSEYYDAAVELSEHFQLIVFGHTHGAMQVPIGLDKRYINTGTWANLMDFPAQLRNPHSDPQIADRVFTEFTNALRNGQYQQYIQFRPHYAKIEVDAREQLVSAELRAWPTHS